jgi:uncharacterized membrane protein
MELGNLIEIGIAAYGSGMWSVLVGVIIMVLIAIARPLLSHMANDDKLKKFIPWVSAVVGMLTALAGALLAGQPWYSALGVGLVTGSAAVGFRELLGKSIFKRKA